MTRKFQLLEEENVILMWIALHWFSPVCNNQLKSLIAVGSANAETLSQAAMEVQDSSSHSIVIIFT